VEESPVVETPVVEEAPPPVDTTPVEIKNEETSPVEMETPNAVETPDPVPVDEVSSRPAEIKAKDNKMNLKLVVVITLVSALVAAFVSGGVYVYLSGLEDVNRDSGNEVILEPEPTSTTSPTPTPTPEAEVDLSEYAVQVLNGSGAIGAASGGE